MASKSRLGKGLGALFPSLPGEHEEHIERNKNAVNVAEKKNDNPAANLKISQEHASNSGSSTVDVVTASSVSAGSSSSASSSTTSVSRVDKKQNVVDTKIPVSQSSTSSTNVENGDSTSNNTGNTHVERKRPAVPAMQDSVPEVRTVVSSSTHSGSRTGKRVSMPGIADMAHPSDMFFGAPVSLPNTAVQGSETSSKIRENQPTNSLAGKNETNDVNGNSSKANDADVKVDNTARKTVTAGSGHTAEKSKKVTKTSVTGSNTDKGTDKGTAEDLTKDSKQEKSENEELELKPVAGGYLAELSITDIVPNSQQPRTVFDEDELNELSASIAEVGVLQPIVVRKIDTSKHAGRVDSVSLHTSTTTDSVAAAETKNSDVSRETSAHYELIMGERRWRASQLAGLTTIPAIVKTTSDDEMLRDALLENLHRVALNPLEEAAAYQQMIDEFGLTQAELSKSISKSRPQIANTLRLLNLPAVVQKKVAAGVLSAGHARALLALNDESEMEKLATRIIGEGLSVRSTEEIVALKNAESTTPKKQRANKNNPWAGSPILNNLENRFDTKVAIKGTPKHGRIEIVFSSPEDMDRILGLLMPNETLPQSDWV